MLTDTQVDQYLARIDYQGPLAVDSETLTALHLAHLYRVPFENLDIALGRPIRLSEAAIFDKLINRRRGGFCYEANYGLAMLLEALGFEVALLAARVYDGDKLGPPFDHLLLQVRLNGQPWIADVGFGDSFQLPLHLDTPHAEDGDNAYKITRDGEQRILWQGKRGERDDWTWQAQYQFTTQAHVLADFEPMCRHQQTSPDSIFTQKSVCTLAMPDGRLTLANGRLIESRAGRRTETAVTDEARYRQLLERHFGVVLPAGSLEFLLAKAVTANP